MRGMNTPIDHSWLIDQLGGPAAVARELDIKPPSVTEWRAKGIPEGRLVRLAVIADQRGICTRRQLLPDAWQKYWPELATTEETSRVS